MSVTALALGKTAESDADSCDLAQIFFNLSVSLNASC